MGACNDTSSLYTFANLYACNKEVLNSLAGLILFGPHQSLPLQLICTGPCPHADLLQEAHPALSLCYHRQVFRQPQDLLEDSSWPCWALLHYLTAPNSLPKCTWQSCWFWHVLETLALLCPSLLPVFIPHDILDRGETLTLSTRAEGIPECLQGGPWPLEEGHQE